jgi:flagellar protein FlbT
MGNIRLFIHANHRLFINGAVLRVDRKVSVELLNDATFLLENHVLHKHEATTPMRQLYFVVQMLLMDPANSAEPKKLFRQMVANMLAQLTNPQLIQGIKLVDIEVSTGKVFAALKLIRELYPVEEEILNPTAHAPIEQLSSGNKEKLDSTLKKGAKLCQM